MEARRPIPDGFVAGLAAGVTVIVVFLVYDVVRVAPLSTPFELAGILFGAEGPPLGLTGQARLAAIASAIFRILAYTGFHLLVFGALGAGAVWLFNRMGRSLNVFTGALYGLIVCTAVLYGAFWLVWTGVSAPSLTGVLLANAAAGAVLAWRVQASSSAGSS